MAKVLLLMKWWHGNITCEDNNVYLPFNRHNNVLIFMGTKAKPKWYKIYWEMEIFTFLFYWTWFLRKWWIYVRQAYQFYILRQMIENWKTSNVWGCKEKKCIWAFCVKAFKKKKKLERTGNIGIKIDFCNHSDGRVLFLLNFVEKFPKERNMKKVKRRILNLKFT